MSYRILLIFYISLSIVITFGRANVAYQPIALPNAETKVDRQLREQIKAIAVKIAVDKSSGSGIIIRKSNNIYTVVTNRHVVDRGDRYQIKTADSYVYQANLALVSEQDDLAILEFTSDRFYSVANINLAPLQLHQPLLAAGFPFNSDCLQVTLGKLFLKTNKPLKQGYQLGYSNTVYQGMSGGGIFNSLGQVVGVNGRSANPIIADYQYQDATYPSQQQQQQMAQLSWGIPIFKVIESIGN